MNCTPSSSTQIDFSSDGLVISGHFVHLPDREESGLARDRRLVTINVLPNELLGKIFSFVNIRDRDKQNPWHTLVHVCHRWRELVFASPLPLNVRLEYGGHRPMSEVLDTWPVLPIALISNPSRHPKADQWWDNVVATLESEYYNHICEVHISDMTKSRWERFTAAMQKPFPELTHLKIWVFGRTVPASPASFLSSLVPGLRTLSLGGIPFPSMSKLLLSANGLVTLILWELPNSGYILPDVMATALTVMPRLETLHIGFLSSQPRPGPASRPLPPLTRFVLPALTKLMFEGGHEYLEDLLTPIDAPLLYELLIIFFMDLNFDVPQLHRLIGNAEGFKTIDHAGVSISKSLIQLSLYYSETGAVNHRGLLDLKIYCSDLDGQLSSLAQVCTSSFPLISALEGLKIRESDWSPSSSWGDGLKDSQWLEVLGPFTALKNLYLTDGIALRVSGALKELSVESATEILPALRNLFVRDVSSLQPIQEALMPFVAARQLSGRPVTIDHWQR